MKTRTVVQIRTHAQKYFQKLEKTTGQKGIKMDESGTTAEVSKSKLIWFLCVVLTFPFDRLIPQRVTTPEFQTTEPTPFLALIVKNQAKSNLVARSRLVRRVATLTQILTEVVVVSHKSHLEELVKAAVLAAASRRKC